MVKDVLILHQYLFDGDRCLKEKDRIAVKLFQKIS